MVFPLVAVSTNLATVAAAALVPDSFIVILHFCMISAKRIEDDGASII